MKSMVKKAFKHIRLLCMYMCWHFFELLKITIFSPFYFIVFPVRLSFLSREFCAISTQTWKFISFRIANSKWSHLFFLYIQLILIVRTTIFPLQMHQKYLIKQTRDGFVEERKKYTRKKVQNITKNIPSPLLNSFKAAKFPWSK